MKRLKIHITGRAGAGKTRLAEWLADQLLQQGHAVRLIDEGVSTFVAVDRTAVLDRHDVEIRAFQRMGSLGSPASSSEI